MARQGGDAEECVLFGAFSCMQGGRLDTFPTPYYLVATRRRWYCRSHHVVVFVIVREGRDLFLFEGGRTCHITHAHLEQSVAEEYIFVLPQMMATPSHGVRVFHYRVRFPVKRRERTRRGDDRTHPRTLFVSVFA